MNGKNLNVRYRRNSYAKKRIKVIAIISCIAVAALVVVLLIVGGLLKEKTDRDKLEDMNKESDVQNNIEEHIRVESVKGYGVSLSGATSNSLADKVTAISKSGGNGLSFLARDDNGKELYSSSVAKSMGKQSGDGYVTINTITSRAAYRGYNTSAIVDVTAFNKKDDIERSVLLAYDAAVCAELCRGGIDDVIIRLDGTDISENNIDELVRFAESVKAIEEDSVIGIALTRKMLESSSAEVLVARLWEKYDLLALDISSDFKDDGDPYEYAYENVSGKENQIFFYVLRHNMRVLLPELDDASVKKMAEAISDKGHNNWQTVAK